MLWDLNIRLFHILLILIICISIISAKMGFFYIHEVSGVTLLCIVTFRIYWGFFGSYFAKFKNFNLNYESIKKFLKTKDFKYFGHNPLGSISIISLLILTIVISVSGLFSSDDIIYDGPLVFLAPGFSSIFTKIHNLSHYILYFQIFIHLCAVFFYQFYKKKLIIQQMIDGKSRDQNFKNIDFSPRKMKLGFFILILCSFSPLILYLLTYVRS